jgi:NAD(P) transhydrogenase subunit alpha
MNELVVHAMLALVASFAGYSLIGRVPTILHTPLMSGTNAMHGLVLVGGIVSVALATDLADQILATVIIALSTANLAGGMIVTNRLLASLRSPAAKGVSEL